MYFLRPINFITPVGFCLLALASSLLLHACGSSDDDDVASGPQIFSKNYSIVSGSPSVDSTISGSGILSFGEDLILERRSESNFYLDFELAEIGSYVQLHSYADSALGEGQVIRLERQANNLLSIRYTQNTGALASLAELATGIDASGRIQISLDVHNGEDNGSHVIGWQGDTFSGEPVEVLDGYFGRGTYVGLALEGATIYAFTVGAGEAADEED